MRVVLFALTIFTVAAVTPARAGTLTYADGTCVEPRNEAFDECQKWAGNHGFTVTGIDEADGPFFLYDWNVFYGAGYGEQKGMIFSRSRPFVLTALDLYLGVDGGFEEWGCAQAMAIRSSKGGHSYVEPRPTVTTCYAETSTGHAIIPWPWARDSVVATFTGPEWQSVDWISIEFVNFGGNDFPDFTRARVDALHFVPEPATGLLLAAGIAAAGRRRQRQ